MLQVRWTVCLNNRCSMKASYLTPTALCQHKIYQAGIHAICNHDTVNRHVISLHYTTYTSHSSYPQNILTMYNTDRDAYRTL